MDNEYARIIARAWRDDAFRQRLISNPREVFREAGIDIPAGAEVSVRQGSSTNRYEFVLPPRPQGIGDDELEQEALRAKCF